MSFGKQTYEPKVYSGIQQGDDEWKTEIQWMDSGGMVWIGHKDEYKAFNSNSCFCFFSFFFK